MRWPCCQVLPLLPECNMTFDPAPCGHCMHTEEGVPGNEAKDDADLTVYVVDSIRDVSPLDLFRMSGVNFSNKAPQRG